MLTALSVLLVVLLLVLYGALIEAHWLACRHIELSKNSALRIAHISDLHYAGNKGYMHRVVEAVNAQAPDIVCITGDFVSNAKWLTEALEQLKPLAVPVYAVPGNWDYWSRADLSEIAAFCERTGGRLLRDESVEIAVLDLTISGAEGKRTGWITEAATGKHILLVHYPAFADSLAGRRFDLILAGHAHGGQVRLPLVGAILVPYDVGRYDLGLFETPGGPLYVTAGIGRSANPVRLGCRPEIAIIDL